MAPHVPCGEASVPLEALTHPVPRAESESEVNAPVEGVVAPTVEELIVPRTKFCPRIVFDAPITAPAEQSDTRKTSQTKRRNLFFM
jgi:hypothetical protein